MMVIGDVQFATWSVDRRDGMGLHERFLFLGLQRGQMLLLVVHFNHAHRELSRVEL